MKFIHFKDGSCILPDVIVCIRPVNDRAYGPRMIVEYEIGGKYMASIVHYESMDECLKDASEIVKEIEAATNLVKRLDPPFEEDLK